MHRFGRTKQNWPDSNIAAGRGFEQVIGDIGRVDIGQNQQIGIAQEGGIRHERQSGMAVQRHVAMHFTIYF